GGCGGLGAGGEIWAANVGAHRCGGKGYWRPWELKTHPVLWRRSQPAATETAAMKRPRRIKIVVGTRGSELALKQTRLVVDRLQARWASLKFEIKVIKTRGDDAKTAIRDVRASRKGFFTGAIERALLRKKIDLAVHSAKDLPSRLAL